MEWAITCFLAGGLLGLWAGHYNERLKWQGSYHKLRAALQPRYATDAEASEAGKRLMQKHAPSLKRLAEFSKVNHEAAHRKFDPTQMQWPYTSDGEGKQ